jgi:TonB family protein
VRAAWQKELIAHFNQHKHYPANGSLHSADILVNFVLNEDGRVLSSAIARGSGDASFDEPALAMIRRSDPVPKPPPLVVQQGLSFTLPVIFRPYSFVPCESQSPSRAPAARADIGCVGAVEERLDDWCSFLSGSLQLFFS